MKLLQCKRGFLFLKYFLFRPHYKGHGIHSPFMYRFVINVLNPVVPNDPVQGIRMLQRQLLDDKSLITIEDLGAASDTGRKTVRSVRYIAKNSSSTIKYGKLLYNVTSYFQPASILELGTGLGLGTVFMATGCPTSKILSMEGSQAILERARKNFEQLQIKSVRTHQGNFTQLLANLSNHPEKFDLIFMDGNHRYEPTLSYFDTCLSCLNPPGIIILDDIRWSPEMYRAWQQIIQDKRVNVSIDLFQLGILFINPKLRKQHFFIYY